MAPISESFKRDPDKNFILNYAPIFTDLNIEEKELIAQKSRIVEYRKGDLVYKQHDLPSAFYCLIAGRVKAFTHKETLEYLSCGNYFGIISLLTGEPHSVNAAAVNDSKILVIPKDDFQKLLDEIPKLAIDLSRTLSRRLRKKDIGIKKIFESNIISIFGTDLALGRAIYAVNLSLSLAKETHKNVVIVDISENINEVCRALGLPMDEKGIGGKHPTLILDTPLPDEHKIKHGLFEDLLLGVSILNVQHQAGNQDYAASLNALLTYLAGHYHYVIVNLPAAIDTAVFQILNQSDLIHIVTACDAYNLGRARGLVSDLFEKVNYPQEKIKIIIDTKKDGSCVAPGEAVKIMQQKIYATLPLLEEAGTHLSRLVLDQPNSEYAHIVRRLAREIGDVRVGLALSGGAAFGLSHIGVIKALEKEGIHIDMVSGSSMGAFIGALWAAGFNAKELEDIAYEFRNDKKKTFRLLMDLCFPKMAFARGRNIRKLLERYLGKKTFKDIKFPFKVIACNLSKRQEVIYDSGKLVDAVMASIAIPAIFAPTRINGDLIVDGGIIEPVPIGILVRSGIRKIIAVNVLPSPENIDATYKLNLQNKEEERLAARRKGFWARLGYALNSWLQARLFPNIFDIIVNSIQTTEYVIAEADCEKADIVLRPLVVGVDWYEFFKAEALINKGEEEANNALADIKALLSE